MFLPEPPKQRPAWLKRRRVEKPEQGGRQGSHQGEGKAPAPSPGRTELMQVVGKPGHKAPRDSKSGEDRGSLT